VFQQAGNTYQLGTTGTMDGGDGSEIIVVLALGWLMSRVVERGVGVLSEVSLGSEEKSTSLLNKSK